MIEKKWVTMKTNKLSLVHNPTCQVKGMVSDRDRYQLGIKELGTVEIIKKI